MDILERIINTPMDALRFRDFMSLKCGHDGFSSQRLPKLQVQVSATIREEARSTFPESEKDQAVCLRWVLRGLPFEKTVRKVKTDLEVGQNARVAHYDH